MFDRVDWDTLFLANAFLVAQRSPDAETKHGAVLVDDRRRILGTGFNGFPRGAKDVNLPKVRPHKYPFVIHAEVNALINARFIDHPEKCAIYITGEPCNECFKLILQHGIGRIVYGQVGSNCINSDEEHDLVRAAITEGMDIDIRIYDRPASDIAGLLRQAASYVEERAAPATP